MQHFIEFNADKTKLSISGRKIATQTATWRKWHDGREGWDFEGRDLTDINFVLLSVQAEKLYGHKLDLTDACFAGATLVNTSFDMLNLARAEFLGEMVNCSFWCTNLNQANFAHMDIKDTSFQNATLHKAILYAAIFTDCSFYQLRGAHRIEMESTQFRGCDLADTKFVEAVGTPNWDGLCRTENTFITFAEEEAKEEIQSSLKELQQKVTVWMDMIEKM